MRRCKSGSKIRSRRRKSRSRGGRKHGCSGGRRRRQTLVASSMRFNLFRRDMLILLILLLLLLLITFMLEKPADAGINIAVRCCQRALRHGQAEAHTNKTAAAAFISAAERTHSRKQF
jgi:hypothetical protein